MDKTGSVCPWGGHPQRDLPRHPARIAAVRESEWDRIAREDREDERRRDAMDALQAARDAAHGCCEDNEDNGRDE